MKIRGQEVLDPEKRLMSLVDKDTSTGCWNWVGAKKGDGLKAYGSLIVGSRTNKTRRTISAHRYSYEVFIGPITNGLWVLHTCDNPSCINPEHLFLGNRQDNVNDREVKSRNKTPCLKHENHPNAKLTSLRVDAIREGLKHGTTCTVLGREFSVNYKTISDIKTGKTWIPDPPKV